MYKNITISSVLGGLAVILGAFGAHALKSKLSPEALNSFETAVHYQIYHVLLLFFINLNQHLGDSTKNRISLITFIGIVLFSGSIYVIHLLGIPAKSIWFITPLGGVFLIVAWFMLAFNFFKKVIKKE